MRARALLLLFGGLAACGGESILVPVTMSLHPGTCTTASPAQVSLSCDSKVGLWVKRGDEAEPDTLDNACVDFPSNGQTLAELPAVLASNADLSGISAGKVWLEIGVYSPAGDEGCPEISALADSMVAYGRTVATEIANASRGVSIDLFCYAVDDGSTPADCTAECERAHDYCPDAFESGTCDLDYDDCFNACPADDEPCYALCDQAYNDCLDGEPTPCADIETLCYDDCAGDLTCEDACTDDYDTCVDMNCETGHTTCLGRCGVLEQGNLCASAI